MCAFKIAAAGRGSSRLHPLSQKRTAIAAFDDDGDDEELPPPAPSASAAGAGVSGANKPAPGADALVECGVALASEGKHEAALDCWDQAVASRPRDARLHEMRAQVLNDVGRAFEAVEAAARAVDLAPRWADARITLARAQRNYGEPQLALASYQAAAALEPGHPDVAAELPAAQMLAQLQSRAGGGVGGVRARVVDDVAAEEAAIAAEAEAEAAAHGLGGGGGGGGSPAGARDDNNGAAASEGGEERADGDSTDGPDDEAAYADLVAAAAARAAAGGAARGGGRAGASADRAPAVGGGGGGG